MESPILAYPRPLVEKGQQARALPYCLLRQGRPWLISPCWRAMIDHTGIGVADVRRSAAFYNAALSALGLRPVIQIPEGVGTDGIGYGVNYPVFWIDRYHPHSVRQHTAFAAKSRVEVDAFYAAALKPGEADNGASGLRRAHYYAAFVLDPEEAAQQKLAWRRDGKEPIHELGARAHESAG